MSSEQDAPRVWRADDGTIFIRAGTYTLDEIDKLLTPLLDGRDRDGGG